MAQIYKGPNATQITPSSVASVKIATGSPTNSASGVVFLIGEADAGPHWSAETTLQDNGFGPDQASDVKAKYGGGPLVDAVYAGRSPVNDERIQGAPTNFILIKTNTAAQASGALSKVGGGTYGTLYDRLGGQLGNLISDLVESAQAEAVPTTGSFTYIPPVGSVQVGARLNGGALLTAATIATNAGVAVATNGSPTAAVAAINALAGIGATGGAARVTIQGSVGNLAVTGQVASQITIGYTGTFTATPAVGDTVIIPATSVIAGTGAGVKNVGAYVVTGATANSITCIKLSNAGDLVSAIGAAVVTPENDPGAAVSATVANDLIVYSPVTVSVDAGVVVDGVGKTLELCELTGGTDLLSRTAFGLGTVTAVTWVSKAGTANVLTSATEYRAKLSTARQADSVAEDVTAGGDVALLISYTGATASVTITSTTMTGTRTTGTGADLPTLTLSQFPTIADLATYINSLTGWSASVGSTGLGQRPTSSLDRGTFSCATEFGAKTGRIKMDALKFFEAIRDNLALVQLSKPEARVDAGLPAVSALAFLAGGAKGATTSAAMSAAIDAVRKLRGNFLVSLVSRDASSDIVDGLTDAASTYTIDAVHAAMRTCVIERSKIKARKNSQGFVSYRGTYATAKEKAGTMASARISVSFQDQIVLSGTTGELQQFHPWMDSVISASAQAAAGYKALVRKFKNVTGSIQAAGDWTGSEVSETDDALQAGLLPTIQHEDGGFIWVSDQTSYSRDGNPIYNSIQAIYDIDQVAMETAKFVEDEFIGENFSDTPTSLIKASVETKFLEFLGRKLLAPSDDAPSGFRNVTVRRSGPAFVVDAEVKLNGVNYFGPINFLVTQVQQSS